mgnify:CR=1 FL=1|jgi:hypothetical protein
MQTSDLPSGERKPALNFEHFPNRLTAFVFRNWNLLPLSKLAAVVRAPEAELAALAALTGLPSAADPGALWRERGYITLIRQNWHLLPFEQLLELLDWTPERLAHCLKEDDFLWHKLGDLKPETAELRWSPLNAEETRRAAEIGQLTAEWPRNFKPFEFMPSPTLPADAPSPDLRMIYPYDTVYGDPLLDDSLNGFPETMFRDYQAAGINAIWMPALVYQLAEWSRAPEMAAQWQKRRANLRKLTARAARYDIEIILYFNEPRSVLPRYAEMFADLKGVGGLCTSQPEVLDYLRDALGALFADCPLLGGIFTITCSENPTNCASHRFQTNCPRCAPRPAAEIIAETVNAMADGVFRAKPAARVLAYTWAWPEECRAEIIAKLHPGVRVLSVSEWGVETDCEGFKSHVIDYSISHPGPSPAALEGWRLAQERGLACAAKIQINNSWELSAVPYLPVYDLFEEHLDNLRRAGVRDFMLSWTLGGFPSPVIALLNHPKERIALELYGESIHRTVLAAWKCFSDAFRHFPFDQISAIYQSPVNCGCANLLWRTPTGYKATMVGIPYDDLDGWRGIYPPDVFERAFGRMTDGWAEGLALLDEARATVAPEFKDHLAELQRIAEAAFCHLKSTENQIAFIRGRDSSPARLKALLNAEIELTERLLRLQAEDARIGFESSNHYYYTPNLLQEKILNCRWLREDIE